jgi:uncharacterized protein
MTKLRKTILAALAASAMGIGAGFAIAQSSPGLSSALGEGAVGEQADGYMGFRKPPTAAIRAEVDAINIKRRALYTQLADQKGVTVKDVAATTGCKTLADRVAVGRSYLLPDGVWRTKDAQPIALPSYCVA